MKQLQKAWNYMLGNPFKWLWRYFFRIDQFMQETENKDAKARRKLLLRLILPMFLVAYPLALLLGMFVSNFQFNWLNLVLAVTVGTLSGIIVGLVWDNVANAPVGILGGIWLGIWLGMWAGLDWLLWLGILLTTIGGLALGTGLVGGIDKITARSIKEHEEFLKDLSRRANDLDHVKTAKDFLRGMADVIPELMGVGAFYLTKGYVPSINQSQAKRNGMSIVRCLIVSTVALVVSVVITSIGYEVQQWPIWWAITMGSLAGILAGMTLSQARSSIVDWGVGMGGGIIIGCMLGNIRDPKVFPTALIVAAVTAIAWGVGIYMGANSVGKIAKPRMWIFLAGIAIGIIPGSLTGPGIAFGSIPGSLTSPGSLIFIFLFCYIISYYRAPLGWMSELSIGKAEKATRKAPDEVFTYLSGSSLYWDEWRVLPLSTSAMTYLMESALEQDINKSLAIIAFIVNKRPHQIRAARTSFFTIITSELETQKTLRDIAETTQRLSELQSRTTALGISGWLDSLALLKDVCLDATHYRNSLGWQARHNTLQHMIMNLKALKETYEDLKDVINRWEGTAQHELDKLQQESQKADQINNPYVVGQALQLGTSLFVGRQDLIQQLEQGLGRGSHHPTFFLNGERRMGKSSTLRQLPHLLDERHFLPIFFDLQAPEMTSSIAAFLGTIAEKIHETIATAGMHVEVLDKQHLQEAQQVNEAEVYYIFNEWLKRVEQVLEQNGRIVLLSFDEFENLEMVGQAKYLDLHLLLNWFRSVIQNRPQLALLFSGGKSVSEMGVETGLNWSGYFVNVQTFRVGFLRASEARQLITQPIPDYPIEQIFGEGVVDAIIHETGCHPFLVQAICSNLINNLNADNRDRAGMQDVEMAKTQVLEYWEDSYFQDLWIRTDQEQRTCLIALNELGKGDLQHIAQQVNATKESTRGTLQTVRHALQVLLKRDLVLLENGDYRIATPIFSQWVERSS